MKQHLNQAVFSTMMTPFLRGLGSFIVGDFVPVFMLHRVQNNELGIDGISLNLLRQMLEVSRKFKMTPITIDEALIAKINGTKLPDNPIAFTIDDGFFDNAELALPLLLEFDIPGTCFLLSGFLDGDLWPWDDKVAYCFDNSRVYNKQIELADNLRFTFKNESALITVVQEEVKSRSTIERQAILSKLALELEVDVPDVPPDKYRPMTWEQAKRLESSGACFGCHGVTHNIFSKMTDNEAAWEIKHATSRMYDELQNPSRVFCYPTGREQDFSLRDKKLLEKNNYIGAVSTIPGAFRVSKDRDTFSLRRYAIPDNIATFIQYLSWFECWRNSRS